MSSEATIGRQSGGVLVIQDNWEEAQRKNEDIWVYYKQLHEKSLHGNIGDGNFDIVLQNSKAITVCYSALNKKTRFVGPVRVFSGIHSKSVVSIDVADGGLGVSVSTDNKLHVWETRNGLVRRRLEGHVFDVYSCRLFPSGVVVLSGGADMQIKIWDAATGCCPATLKGHTAPVMDTCVVDKGRNIISVSKDGTARLWNCALEKCVDVLYENESEIYCCDIIHVGNGRDAQNDMETSDELEFGTHDKLLAIGCEIGKLVVISVNARTIIATHSLGLEDGRVMLLNEKRPLEVPQLLCHDSASAVLCIKPVLKGFILGRRDGICQYYKLDGVSSVQLTGVNCDPVYDLAVDSQFVYTACRDALIRKYKIEDMSSEET